MCDPLGLGGGRAMLCHARAGGARAGARASAMHGKVLRESQAFPAFHFLPDMFTATWILKVFPNLDESMILWRVLSSWQWPSSHADWLDFITLPCAPAQPLSIRTLAPQWAAAGVSWTLAQHGAQVGPCLSAPACGSGRPRCHEVCTASASLHTARRGRACVGQLRRLLESGLSPNNGWRAGNAAWETGFGSTAAASHGPLAPFLSFPCSREPFPQPSAARLHRGDGDAAAQAGWGIRPSARQARRGVGTRPGQAGGSACLREP